jgi:hypothetical protein
MLNIAIQVHKFCTFLVYILYIYIHTYKNALENMLYLLEYNDLLLLYFSNTSRLHVVCTH